MMKIAGGWSSSTVAESYIARSKRTIQQVAAGIGFNSAAGYTVAEVSTSTASANTVQESPAKKMRSNENIVYHIGVQNTYHVENMSGNFYIGYPPALPATCNPPQVSKAPNSPLVLRIPLKKL